MSLSCGVCYKRFKYKELIKRPSWNGKWTDWLSPCCKSVEWMPISELVKADPNLMKAYKA